MTETDNQKFLRSRAAYVAGILGKDPPGAKRAALAKADAITTRDTSGKPVSGGGAVTPAMGPKEQDALIEAHALKLSRSLGRPVADIAAAIRAEAPRQTSDDPSARITMAATVVAGRVQRREA